MKRNIIKFETKRFKTIEKQNNEGLDLILQEIYLSAVHLPEFLGCSKCIHVREIIYFSTIEKIIYFSTIEFETNKSRNRYEKKN